MSRKRRQASVDSGTTYFFLAMDMTGSTVHYRGFIEVRRLDRLNSNGNNALVVVQSEGVMRWFLYDKYYPDAIKQLVSFWKNTYGETPRYKKTRL